MNLYAQKLKGTAPSQEWNPEWAPDNSLERKVASARKEMGEAKWAKLMKEWDGE